MRHLFRIEDKRAYVCLIRHVHHSGTVSARLCLVLPFFERDTTFGNANRAKNDVCDGQRIYERCFLVRRTTYQAKKMYSLILSDRLENERTSFVFIYLLCLFANGEVHKYLVNEDFNID